LFVGKNYTLMGICKGCGLLIFCK